MFVQNVHNFRDDCLIDGGPPKEHVALFDEARQKTADAVFRPHSGRPSGGIHPVGPGAHSAWPSARFAGNSAKAELGLTS